MLRHAATLAALFAASSAVWIDQENLPNTGLDTTNWTTGVLPPLTDMWSINDFQIAAKNVMSLENYVYYRTGALDEITYNANLAIWQNVRMNGFSFQDVSDINLNTTILGYNFSAPFFIAPAAQAGRANETVAERGLVEGAAAGGVLYVPSISSTLSIEHIAQAAAPGQVMFHQEYVWANTTRLKSEIRDIERAGFKALFLTVDNTGINGIRTRQLRVDPTDDDTGHSATFTFAALAAIQNMTRLPVVPKGIRSATDALKCLALGFPAIYVTNHGGRTLDGAPTAVEILLDIRKNAPQVFDKMEVYADGGVRRGTDVIKLLALGARAVGLGRSPMFANIYGAPGVTQMIEMMKTELTTTLGLLGQADIHLLNATNVNTNLVENMWF